MLLEPLIKKLFFPYFAARDGCPDLYDHLASLEESQYWSLPKIEEMQFQKMKTLCDHAYRNTKFYRKRFDDNGFNPDKMKDLDSLKTIPPLTKEDIRDHLDDLKADTFSYGELNSSLSGGTTGLVTKFFLNRSCLSPKQAAVMRFDKWTGWDIGEWMGLVWPATLEIRDETSIKNKIKNYASSRRIKIALTVIDEKLIEEHVKLLKKRRATMVRAFPTPLASVAEYILGREVKDLDVKGIVTTGEPLYPQQRETVERAFQCRVYDSYRTRECGPIAQQCDLHEDYHINAEGIYLETVPFDNGQQSDWSLTAPEKILVTDLDNFGMPFIRYEIGDTGTLSYDDCGCGRGLPLLKTVGGRLVDVVYTPDKRKIASITLIPNLVHAPGIENRVQFIQDRFDHLHIKMTKPPPPQSALKQQRQVIDRIFGPQMTVTYEYVDDIPLLKSGKYAFIICTIPEKHLEGL